MMEVALMLMEEPCFDILRTKEQLGYTVFSVLRNTYGILGVSITVNSQATKFSVDHVNDRIEAFLKWFVDDKLKNLDDSEYSETIATLIKMKKAADVTLSEEAERNWAEIICCEYVFDRCEKQINILEGCKKDEMIQHITSIIQSMSDRKKLSVQVVGNPDGIKIQEEYDDDNEEGQQPEPVPPPSDLDPNGVFELDVLKGDDASMSQHFITDLEAFKKSLRTYEVTH